MFLSSSSFIDGVRGASAATPPKRRRIAAGSGGGGGNRGLSGVVNRGLSGVINRAIASLKTSQGRRGNRDAARPKTSRRKRDSTVVVSPTIHNYGIYANIANLEPNVFPSVKEERAFDTMEACEFDAFNEKSCLDDKFLHAVYAAFNAAKTLLAVKQTRTQIQGQLNGTGTYRKWVSWYQQDSRLGLFRNNNNGVPLMIHVSLLDSRGGGDRPAVDDNRRVNRVDKFSRFAQERNLRPIRLSLGRVLCANEKIVATEKPRVDSLQANELKELRGRSLFYRRVYLAHLLVYVVLAECLHCSDRTVNLIIESRLRSLFQLPTSLSVAIHSEPRINIHYL